MVLEGSECTKRLWRDYSSNLYSLISVVYSDSERNLSERFYRFNSFIRVENQIGIDLLSFNKKQDLAQLSIQRTDKLRLNEINDRKWLVQPSSSISCEGLLIELNWLYSLFKEKEVISEIQYKLNKYKISVTLTNKIFYA